MCHDNDRTLTVCSTIPSMLGFLLLTSVPSFLNTPHVATQDNKHPIQPDPTVQAQLRMAVDAVTDLDICRETVKLRALATKDERQFVQQLIYFASVGQDVKERMAIYLATDVLELSQMTVIDAVVPYIETKHESLNQVVQKVLKRIENTNGRKPDFSYYREYIALRKSKPPEQLVAHMYMTAPDSALLTMLGIYVDRPEQQKPILWGEHVVNDVLWKQQYGFLRPDEIEAPAAEHLDKLSRHDEWWVRLYVAEILSSEAEFRTPEMVKRLKEDSHPLVRKAMTRQKQ